MSFIDDLKVETGNSNHCMEDVIIEKYIEALKIIFIAVEE